MPYALAQSCGFALRTVLQQLKFQPDWDMRSSFCNILRKVDQQGRMTHDLGPVCSKAKGNSKNFHDGRDVFAVLQHDEKTLQAHLKGRL